MDRSGEILNRLPSGSVIGAEIGVFAGKTSLRLLRREDLVLYMVDNWKPFKVDGFVATKEMQERNYKTALDNVAFANGRAKIMVSDSVDAAKNILNDSLDFVFIDANHNYQSVSEDIETWYPKLKKGALLCGHDYGNNEFDYGMEVIRAVHDAASRHEWKVEAGEDFTWFVTV